MPVPTDRILFIQALNALCDLYIEKRAANMTSAAGTTTTKKASKFVSVLDHIGHDFKVGLTKIMPFAEGAGEVAVSIFAPGASALFNQTVAAVATAEQSAAAVGQQSGTGPQKLAAVAQLMGPLIKQALADVGKPNDDTAVNSYISSVVTILNAMPASEPASTAVAVSAPAVAAPTPSAVSGGTAAASIFQP
jgi:hypothetical protein